MIPTQLKRLFPALALPMILSSAALKADVPNVVADIAPVHSLVSMVMKGIGEPQLLIPQNASPHHYAMRPSEARALQEANLVVYLGHDMTPWLEPLFETVAASAEPLNLSEVDGVLQLSYREGPVFDDHEGHDDHDDHEGHDDEEEGHDDHDDHEGHDDEEEGHDDHDDHEGHDDEEEAHDDHDDHEGHENEAHKDDEEGHGAGEFEWAGIFSVGDSSHTWLMQKVGGDYADPTMRLVLMPTDSPVEETMHSLEEAAENLIAGDSCNIIEDGESMAPLAAGSCFELHVGGGNDSAFRIDTAGITGLVVYAQHVPTEFERDQHYLKDSAGTDIEPIAQEGGGDHHHHHHGGNDPHMWLDPANAVVWLDAIASELGRIDPENAARYRANANTAKEEISHEIHHLEDHLKSVQGKGFLVFHDAYQYFENRFGISATGSISLGDASKPNAKRLQELKHHFEEEGIHCVLSEPQYSSKLIDSVFGGFKPHIGVADPIGVDLELGSGLYLELLGNLASGIAECVNH